MVQQKYAYIHDKIKYISIYGHDGWGALQDGMTKIKKKKIGKVM